MLVLLAALLLVYVIFFDVHGDDLIVANTETPTTTNPSLQWSDIDRMVYMDRTRQLSNNPYSDDIYYDTAVHPNSEIFREPNTLTQTQDTQKEPVIVQEAQQDQQGNSLPDVVEDLQGRRFYSTDFLFGRTDTDAARNVGTEANPVGAIASRSGQSEPQVMVSNPTPSPTTTSTPSSTPTASPTVVPIPSSQINLADTRVWDKTMPLMQTLQLDDDVQYILKDMANTHYVKLDDSSEDISQVVSFVWGTTVDITDQITIQNTQLFGSEVTKITLPDYKNNLKELMLITFANGDRRFLQIDKDWYNILSNKLSIKQKFDVHY